MGHLSIKVHLFRVLGLLALSPLLAAPAPAAPHSRHYIDQRTGVDAWRWSGEGISLQLIQRLPDQTRAFFLARGFPRPAVERLASHCVFQTIFHNTAGSGGGVVHLDLANWRIDHGQSLILKKQWQQQWRRMDVPRPARIAFQWSLFPTVQQFAPGDWNMGMTTYPVAPGATVDVHFSWRRHGKLHHGVIQGARCAPDVDMEDKTQ
ncbi:MAG TPA: hypothetical protein VKA14_06770 [Gammaproteobacteria bacterium]|nr:hypothetical protein [Gammaproteobacteria bacterium]